MRREVAYKQNFSKYRKDLNPYNTTSEFIGMDILKDYFNNSFSFSKNERRYDYDVEVKKENKFLGYIEIETHELWKDEYPSNWKLYRFWARKIRENFDRTSLTFTNTPKKNYEKTLYLSFNQNFTDAYCVDLKYIHDHLEIQYRGGEIRHDEDQRVNWLFYTYLNDPRVARGIKDCMNFISLFFTNPLQLELEYPNLFLKREFVKRKTSNCKEKKIF